MKKKSRFLLVTLPIFFCFLYICVYGPDIFRQICFRWLLVSGKPHHLASIVYSTVFHLWWATEQFLTGHGQESLKFKLNVLTKRWVAYEQQTTQNPLFRHYTLEIIVTRKFPRRLPRCAKYAVTEGIFEADRRLLLLP